MGRHGGVGTARALTWPTHSAVARDRSSPSAGAPWAWALSGALAGLILSLLLFAPARWLGSAMQQSTAGQVLLLDARGTVWQGSARLMLAGGIGSSDAAELQGRVRWTLRAALGGLRAQIAADCCTSDPVVLHYRPAWRGGEVRFGDNTSQWPLALLAGLGTPWNTVQPQGAVHLSTRGLSVEWVAGRIAIGGQARMDVLGASSRLSTLRPMGSYRITLNGGSTSTLQLDTLEGRLQLQGSGQWVGSRLRFAGEASAAPEHEAALSNLLNIIGRRSGPRSIITLG
ncbi:MAG: type II secretion system protein N [Burkholderiaceae bacterium]|nr:type II secretion system protein N [Burkholderiaceae bacterium]